MYSTLDPLRDEQEAQPVDFCEAPWCHGEIYQEEIMYFYEEHWICEDCFKAEIEKVLRTNPRTLATALNLDMKRYI